MNALDGLGHPAADPWHGISPREAVFLHYGFAWGIMGFFVLIP